jgi:hypothetical protein
MDLQRRDESKQKLYDLTPADGKSIGNAALRGLLHDAFPNETFSLDDYWDLRNSLIADGKLEKGRGHGGSVRRVITVVEPVAVVNATGSVVPAAGPVQVVVAEAPLYEPFQKCILTGYIPDNDLKPWICEITAFQTRQKNSWVSSGSGSLPSE